MTRSTTSTDDLEDRLSALWATRYHDARACGASEAEAEKIASAAVDRAAAAARTTRRRSR